MLHAPIAGTSLFESSEYAFRMSLEYMINSSRQILKWIEEKGKDASL